MDVASVFWYLLVVKGTEEYDRNVCCLLPVVALSHLSARFEFPGVLHPCNRSPLLVALYWYHLVPGTTVVTNSKFTLIAHRSSVKIGCDESAPFSADILVSAHRRYGRLDDLMILPSLRFRFRFRSPYCFVLPVVSIFECN
jgi:hypothetical protein